MGKRGPKKTLHQRIDIWFVDGTLQRIENVLDSKESRLAFVRQAVDNEIERRAKSAAPRKIARTVT